MATSSFHRIRCHSAPGSTWSGGFSPFRSNARGRSSPSTRIHAVGGWVRYRCDERPSNASRPCSSSKVPSGRPTCACLATLPLDSGNIAGPPPYLFRASLPLPGLAPCSALRRWRDFFLRSRSCAHRTLRRSPRPTSELLGLAALGQLRAALPGGVDRVQERGPYAGLLQVPDGGDRGAPGRCHHLADLHGMLARVPKHLR